MRPQSRQGETTAGFLGLGTFIFERGEARGRSRLQEVNNNFR